MTRPSLKHIIQRLFVVLPATAIISCGSSTSSVSDSDTSTSSMDTSPMSTMPMDTTPATHAEAVISATKADTAVDGSATFDANGKKIKLKIDLTIPKMANKTVAVHIHEHPDCGDDGKATHGHWNPTHMPHGKWGSDSFHLGDIGNIKLDSKGKGSLNMSTDLWTLGADTMSSVLNRAIIVHSGVDDYKTQPTGNAGSRIGCGVIKK